MSLTNWWDTGLAEKSLSTNFGYGNNYGRNTSSQMPSLYENQLVYGVNPATPTDVLNKGGGIPGPYGTNATMEELQRKLGQYEQENLALNRKSSFNDTVSGLASLGNLGLGIVSYFDKKPLLKEQLEGAKMQNEYNRYAINKHKAKNASIENAFGASKGL